MLQPTITQAYGDCNALRHVRYSLTPRDDLANVPNATEEIRAMYEGMYDFKTQTNQNEDGSYMKDETGNYLPGGGSASGTVNVNDTKPEAHRPRYHNLWVQKMGGR
jgi:hypothetical protein